MNIIVCCKQILDPEAPSAGFRIDPTTNKVVLSSDVPSVISPFDGNALEAALRIKEAQGGKITALSLGVNLIRDVLRKPCAMGADELVLLEDEAFGGGDSWSTAYALGKAIEKIGKYDLVLCGRQAADWDAGQVGLGIAEILDLPSVTLARKIDIVDGMARVERVVPDGYEVIEVPLPALITVSNELGQARYPSVKGILTAKRLEPIVWNPSDIGVDPSEVGAAGRRSKLVKLCQPARESKCEMIEGETVEQAGMSLALKLREEKLL